MSIQSALTESESQAIHFSEQDVMEVISQLKSHKTDGLGISTNHLKLASPDISKPLALFFSSILQHGSMPYSCRDCVLVPIPKENKDASSSQNYWPIALSSNLS